MKLTSKKSVLTRMLAVLTSGLMVGALTGCANADADSPDLEETTDAAASDPVEYIPASDEGPAENVPEPQIPADVTEISQQGASATVEFFWEAEQYARLSGETGPLQIVSTQSCEFCQESIEGWQDSYSEGVWTVIEDDLDIEVTNVDIENDDDRQSVAHVFFELEEPATDFYDAHGKRLDESFEKPGVSEWFALLFYDSTAQRWAVDWVGLEEAVVWDK